MRPKKVSGMSRSQFKTFLKRIHHRVPRDFYKTCISEADGRYFRWRLESGEVDVSVLAEDFDRWANSIKVTWEISEVIE